jgi:hypothetical protein
MFREECEDPNTLVPPGFSRFQSSCATIRTVTIGTPILPGFVKDERSFLPQIQELCKKLVSSKHKFITLQTVLIDERNRIPIELPTM